MTNKLARRKMHHIGGVVAETLIRTSGLSTIAFILLIFVFLAREGMPAFFEVKANVLFGTRWYPTEGFFGLWPLMLGSVLVTVGAAVLAMPTGLMAAVFVAEVSPRWLREIVKPVIEVLAGIPSVVLGFLGMLILSPLVRQAFNAPTGLTAFSGSLVLAYMALPTIISVAEDALDSVPRAYRDAALALGATRWQTIWRVTVPAARSGILTALMLGIGRAIGETMAVMMVTGNAARMPLTLDSLMRPVRTMTATIAAEMGEVAQGSTHFHVLFAVGIILFVITFLVNLAASLAIFQQARRAERLLS